MGSEHGESKSKGKNMELGRSGGRRKEWKDDGTNELEVPRRSQNCWREDTGVSELEGHDMVVREWRL